MPCARRRASPPLAPDERRDRLAGGRGQADGRNGAGRDLSIDRHEIADGVEAQVPDDRQDRDDEQRDEEGLPRQPHADDPGSDHARYRAQQTSRAADPGRVGPAPIEHGRPMVSTIVGFLPRKTGKTQTISGWPRGSLVLRALTGTWP